MTYAHAGFPRPIMIYCINLIFEEQHDDGPGEIVRNLYGVGGSHLIQWTPYVTAGATAGLFMVAIATLILAWTRFRRETLSINVDAEYGGVSGEGYHEVGFQVCLINKGAQDVVVYSAGYHVRDDHDDRNFIFPDEYIYYRPAKENDEGSLSKVDMVSRDGIFYIPDSPFLTIHSKFMFPIRIPAGGIYSGLWPVRIVRHREHLAALQQFMYSDYAGLHQVIENPIPYIFFSTIHGTKKVILRPFGRWPRLVVLCRKIMYRASSMPIAGRLRQRIFSPDSDSGYGYWIDRNIESHKKRSASFFPLSRFDDTGIHPMSVDENEHMKMLPGFYRTVELL